MIQNKIYFKNKIMPDKKKKKKSVVNDGKGVGYRESTMKSRFKKAYKAVEDSPASYLIPGMAAKKIMKKMGYKKGGPLKQYD